MKGYRLVLYIFTEPFPERGKYVLRIVPLRLDEKVRVYKVALVHHTTSEKYLTKLLPFMPDSA